MSHTPSPISHRLPLPTGGAKVSLCLSVVGVACGEQPPQLGSSPSSWQHSLGNAENASLLSLLVHEQLHMGGSRTDWATTGGLPRTAGQHDSNTVTTTTNHHHKTRRVEG